MSTDDLDKMSVYERLQAVGNATIGCEMVARQYYCEALKYIAQLREQKECAEPGCHNLRAYGRICVQHRDENLNIPDPLKQEVDHADGAGKAGVSDIETEWLCAWARGRIDSPSDTGRAAHNMLNALDALAETEKYRALAAKHRDGFMNMAHVYETERDALREELQTAEKDYKELLHISYQATQRLGESNADLRAALTTAKDQGEDAWSSGFDSLEHDIAKALGCVDDVEKTVVEKVERLVMDHDRLKHDVPRSFWVCDECDFQLVTKGINMKEGTIGVLHVQNDCGLMRPVTWKEACANQDQADKRYNEIIDEREAEIKRLERARDTAVTEESDVRHLMETIYSEPLLEWTRVSGWVGEKDGIDHAEAMVALIATARDRKRNHVDAENLELRKKLKRFAAWAIHRGQESKYHACAQCYPESDIVFEGFVCDYHQATEYYDHVKCGWAPPEKNNG